VLSAYALRRFGGRACRPKRAPRGRARPPKRAAR